MEWTRDQ